MFWGSSAVVPLLVPEVRSVEMTGLLGAVAPRTRGPEPMALWWASPVECQSALYRRHRQDPIPGGTLRQALERLEALTEDAEVVLPSDEGRRRAGRLLAVHLLRAADALQLAAALAWSEEAPCPRRISAAMGGGAVTVSRRTGSAAVTRPDAASANPKMTAAREGSCMASMKGARGQGGPFDHRWTGVLIQAARDQVEQKGNVEFVGIVYRGLRQTTANKPIYTPADVYGVKLQRRQAGRGQSGIFWPSAQRSLRLDFPPGRAA